MESVNYILRKRVEVNLGCLRFGVPQHGAYYGKWYALVVGVCRKAVAANIAREVLLNAYQLRNLFQLLVVALASVEHLIIDLSRVSRCDDWQNVVLPILTVGVVVQYK